MPSAEMMLVFRQVGKQCRPIRNMDTLIGFVVDCGLKGGYCCKSDAGAAAFLENGRITRSEIDTTAICSQFNLRFHSRYCQFGRRLTAEFERRWVIQISALLRRSAGVDVHEPKFLP